MAQHTKTYSGSCLCGQVRFEIEGQFESFFLCYCGYCRKDTGSAHAANLFSTTASLRWVAGERAVKTFHLPSTKHMKSFCEECGSAMPNLQMGGKLLMVPAGSLDTELTMKPNAHIYHESKAPWYCLLEDLPKFEGSPSQTKKTDRP